MKRFFFASLALAGALILSGCDFLAELLELDGVEVVEQIPYTDKWADMVNETPYDAIVSDNTVTYGSHSYTINADIDVSTQEFSRATASVSFTNIPSGYTEFSAVYKALLGKSLAGTAAMVPMAMEIYARNATTGKKCIDLLCTEGTAGDMVTELKRKIVPSKYSEENDPYIQRFLPAALLKGATPGNGYSPATPYTVEMTMTSNGVKESAQAGGTVTYMCIVTSGGWSSAQRGVDIILPSNADLYKVYGCPGCYAQCQAISGTWSGLK